MSDADVKTEDVVEEDAVRLLKTGQVRFVIDGRVYTLRPPKLKDYMVLKTMLVAAYNDATVAVEAVKAGENATDLLSTAEDTVLEFMLRSFALLSDRKLPTTEEGEVDQDGLPVWFTGASLPREMLKHWRSVPLGRG